MPETNNMKLWLIGCLVMLAVVTAEPNPPNWPGNVYILDPSNPSRTQSIVDKIFAENGGHIPPFNGQWSQDRYALLFLPGNHQVTVNVGYYTHVMGLGQNPTDTVIEKIQVENGDFDYTGGALSNFWRAAENFATNQDCLWAVSQACPLRRAHINGNLALFQYNSGCCAGYASGGFLADSIITGQVQSGSQQQWFTRNSNMGQWDGAVWNMVLLGNTGGIPASHCGNTNGQPFTTIQSTPVIAEKPFIVSKGNQFLLAVPQIETNKVGPSNYANVKLIDFSQVFVATPSDSITTINNKLASGLHLVLTPGNYSFSGSIRVTKANTVVLGIGFPTLETNNGQPVIVVSNVDGVRVSGVLLQASAVNSPTLLEWGTGGYPGNPSNPGFAHDIFTRVGGPNNPAQYQVSTNVQVTFNSGNVILDNAWLWRADHDVSGEVYNSNNPSFNGLVVNGDDVTTYGLAVEHNLHDQVVWNGERGRSYFFQSELPYDVTQQNFGNPGYVGYRVKSTVQNHQSWGPGVYCYFRDNSVTVNNGIVTPTGSGIKITSPFTKFLNGNGQITHVINGKGDPVNSSGAGLSYVCN